MEEQENAQTKETPEEGTTESPKKGGAVAGFLTDILRGVAIGVAFIIPGFSGGSVAAILGIYEKLVGAIADLFKTFKKSVRILLPILLGMLLGIAALIFPIQLGLKHFPIPTVTLFVGLAVGGIPSITEKIKGKPKWQHIIACVLPLIAAACLSFLPLAGEVDLLNQNVGGYFLLVVIGMVGSCALVIPGISGSMLLLIFGYYNPIVQLVTKTLPSGTHVGTCLLVLLCLAVGVVAGFFLISVVMKFLLKRFPKGTYFAILGFIVGSIPAVYASTVREQAEGLTALYANPWYWVVTVLLFAVGFALSLSLVLYTKRMRKNQENEETQKEVEG